MRLQEKCEVLEAKNTETRRELTARISQARQTQQMVRELETSQQRDARTFQRGNRTLLGEVIFSLILTLSLNWSWVAFSPLVELCTSTLFSIRKPEYCMRHLKVYEEDSSDSASFC